MLYMMEWKVKSDSYDKAHNRFLESAAPLPEGSTLLGRWHAPGSANGWLVVETDKPETVYIHAAEWGDALTFEITPVFTDEQAGASSVEGRGRR